MEVLIVVAERPVCLRVVGHVLLDVAVCAHIICLESIHMRFVLVVNHTGTSWLGNSFNVVLSSKRSISFCFLTL